MASFFMLEVSVSTLITFNITPIKRFLALWSTVGLMITLLPYLYLTVVHGQPVSQHCSLLQRVVPAAALCWQPDDPCTPARSPCFTSCLSYQASAGWEHQPMDTCLVLSWCPACMATVLPRPRCHKPASPRSSCKKLPGPHRSYSAPVAAK